MSSKEVDYSLICVSAMHHLEQCQFCIIVRFLGGQSYIAHASAFWMIPWLSVGSTNSANFPLLVMLRSVVIVNMNWCGVSAKKSFCIYQSTTWPGRNIGCIMNLNIYIQKKLYTQARAVCRIVTDLLCDWKWLLVLFRTNKWYDH